MTRFCKGITTQEYKKTIGTDFCEKEIQLSSTGDVVKLMIWDTAGQEMFSRLTRAYYRGAGAVVYVFSTTDRESFVEIERWKQKVEEECDPNIVSVLVQNKVDLLDQARMTAGEVEALAEKLQLKLYRTCVRTNLLVDDVFTYIAERYVSLQGVLESEPVASIRAPPAKTVSTSSSSLSANPTTTASSSSSSNGQPTGSGAAADAASESQSSSSPTPVAAPTAASVHSKSFTLHEPSVRRTKGKKSFC